MSVFLGWLPDEEARRELGLLRDGLRDALPAGAPRHGWRAPAQWHATLRYLGEGVGAGPLDAVQAAMPAIAAAHAGCDVVVEAAQYWPGAKVLVASLSAPPPLRQLHADIEHAMRGLGFAAEKRALKPHVTLAYLSTRDAPSQPAGIAMPAPLRVDRVHLLRTAPGSYMSLASWPLAGPVQDA